MSAKNFDNYHNYCHALNKSIIKNKAFHFLFSLIDTIIIIFKILDIYRTNYNTNLSNSIKLLKPSYFFSSYSPTITLLILTLYIIICYIILISYFFLGSKKKLNKFTHIIINIFEFILIRFLFIFYCELIFSLSSLYFLLFLLLTIPFFAFILIDINFFHLSGFMIENIAFPFDDFTSLCDIQKSIFKILISISSATTDINKTRIMFLSQFILLISFFLYDTYIIFYKSYYLMNNEILAKVRYSNLLIIVFIQIIMIFMKKEEIFGKTFIFFLVCNIIFITIFFFLFYNPYNYIIIDNPENKENLFYYFFLLDRNKNIAFFLEDKIKKHIEKCNCCSLCSKFNEFIKNKIEVENEKNKDINLFYILYNGNDKLMFFFNSVINNKNELGINCLFNNSYYIINIIYIYYYSFRDEKINFPLNLLLIYNLIQEKNQAVISSHKISIRQITYINEYFILVKSIINQIKDIISRNNIKKYIEKLFVLSKKLTLLNDSKFVDNLYGVKDEGIINCSYLISICSLLYEEIFNQTLSNSSIPIRENIQLHEDILKHYLKQNNNITLNFNLKSMECNIIYGANQMYEYRNTNFYELFPNQFKDILIKNFCDIILNSKEKNTSKQTKKKSKSNKKRYIEHTLLINNSNNIDNINYYRVLNLKLALLINDLVKENIFLSGNFIINENIVITIQNKNNKELIFGFGNKDIMEVVFKNNFSFRKFKESEYMRNKTIKSLFSIISNNNIFSIYNFIEKKNKIIITKIKEDKNLTMQEDMNINDNDNEITNNDNNSPIIIENGDATENIDANNNYSNDNFQKINTLLEETMSQSSSVTKTTGNSFWKLNKISTKDEQNHFYSKSLLNLQLLLGGLLLAILIVMITLILQLKIIKKSLTQYSENYFNIRQFVRTYQQFSFSFMAIVCIVKNENKNEECEEYFSRLDTNNFNQSLFLKEQNDILAELCSDSISEIIMNSDIIKDKILSQIFKKNVSYNLVNIKKINNIYDMSISKKNISFTDSLLLLSNNMRIIVSDESKLKYRNKEPIYLIYSLDHPFVNIKNRTNEISDYQISVYTYLINYKLYVQHFSSLNQRLNELINEMNNHLIFIENVFHNIILLIMVLEIITIIFYLSTFNKIIAQIINSIIIKFDLVLDNENDFKKLFIRKINLLENILNIYPINPINYMKEINKNSNEYIKLINAKKKIEQGLNINKKMYIEEEEELLLFKNNQKYITWIDIYKNNYDRFYIIITLIVFIIDITVYFIILGIWKDYQSKSRAVLELIYFSWNFELNTLRIVNFYDTMIFNNQTINDIKQDYYSDEEYFPIENIYKILYSYYELRKKRQKKSEIYKSFAYFADYNCKSLFDFVISVESNSFSRTMKIMNEKYNLNIDKLLSNFVDICEQTQSFIGEMVSPSFQSLYQKIIDGMISFDNRTYEGIINRLFSHSFLNLSSIFLNIEKYIIFIIGKTTYTDASARTINLLENYINFTLILYILSECANIIIFFFIYIMNMNIECKNIFKLKKVFEITKSIES